MIAVFLNLTQHIFLLCHLPPDPVHKADRVPPLDRDADPLHCEPLDLRLLLPLVPGKDVGDPLEEDPASSSHPPRVLNATGLKIWWPSSLPSYCLLFLPLATPMATPAVCAASSILFCCRGLTTVTSRTESLPMRKPWITTSPGLSCVPSIILGTSTLPARLADLATSAMMSLTMLCLPLRPRPYPQFIACSQSLSNSSPQPLQNVPFW